MLTDQEFELTPIYHGIQPYVMFKAMHMFANAHDDDDMILMKADFEAHAQLLSDSKKTKKK